MNPKSHAISPYYVGAAIQGAIRNGYDSDSLLLDSGLDPFNLKQTNNEIRIPPENVTALIRAIWQTMDDEFMGFTAQRCKQGVFAIMAKQAISCTNLREALVQGAHFYHHIRNDIRFKFEEKGEEAILSFELQDPSLDPDYFLIEFFLLIWHRFSNWLVGQRVPLKYATFMYPPPDHVKEYSLLFPCYCRFNQTSNSIVFDTKLLNFPIKQHERELKVFLKNSPADLLSKPVFYSAMTTQVMNLVGESINQTFPLIETVSSYFHMSSRNLRRRLKDEGTSYQKIKDKLRQDLAMTRLRENDLSINQISREVGFNEPAAFTRAFKHWTGKTPRAYRDEKNWGPAKRLPE